MKVLIAAIAITGLSFVAGSIIVGSMVFQGTVNEKPYETGLLWDKVQKEASDLRPDCDINNGSCIKKTGGMEVQFDLTPKPVRTMQELTFTVAIKGSISSDNLIISLEMPGMYMGEYKVIARKSTKGIYKGQGLIPRCLSGKKLWRATVETPSGLNTGFLFEVK